jgi:hypothetical protein
LQDLEFNYTVTANCSNGQGFTVTIDSSITDDYDYDYPQKLLDVDDIGARLEVPTGITIEKVEVTCDTPGVVVYKDLSGSIWCYPTIFTNTCVTPIIFDFVVKAIIDGTFEASISGHGAITGYKPKRMLADTVNTSLKDKVDAIIIAEDLQEAPIVYSIESSNQDVEFASLPEDGNGPVLAYVNIDTLKPI